MAGLFSEPDRADVRWDVRARGDHHDGEETPVHADPRRYRVVPANTPLPGVLPGPHDRVRPPTRSESLIPGAPGVL